MAKRLIPSTLIVSHLLVLSAHAGPSQYPGPNLPRATPRPIVSSTKEEPKPHKYTESWELYTAPDPLEAIASQKVHTKDQILCLVEKGQEHGVHLNTKLRQGGDSRLNEYYMGLLAMASYLPYSLAKEVAAKMDLGIKPVSVKKDPGQHFTLPCGNILDDFTASTQGFYWEGPDFVTMSYRGTEQSEGLADFRTDLQLLDGKMESHRFGPVPPGAYGSAMLAWPTFEKYLKGNSKPIFITGHSLGGWAARLAAGSMRNYVDRKIVPDQYDLRGVYTFGEPRLPQQFTDYYNKITQTTLSGMPMQDYRVINDDDGVVNVGLGNSHAGIPVAYCKQGRFVGAAAKGCTPASMFSALTHPGQSLEDHYMINYMDSISKGLGFDVSSCMK